MPTDIFIQQIAGSGYDVIALLMLLAFVAIAAFCWLGATLERRDREHQDKLERAIRRARSKS